MNKDWCEQKEKEAKANKAEALKQLINEIEQSPYPSNNIKSRAMAAINDEQFSLVSIIFRLNSLSEKATREKYERWFYDVVKPLIDKASAGSSYWMLEDSPEIKFDGDILITDPCYFLTEEDEEKGAYSFDGDFSMIDIPHSMTRGTIYGDWGCTVINTDTNEKLGNFCADSGAVSVVDLNELLAHNPDFNCHIEHPWTSTVIHDFKGTVQFVVNEEVEEYKGKEYVEYKVEVIGRGINKKTGEPLNFKSFQSSL